MGESPSGGAGWAQVKRAGQPRNNPKPLSKDYFGIQLRFAEAVSQKTGIALEHAVFTHTNFYARLSFGTVDDLDAERPAWREFARNLVGQRDRAGHAYEVYLGAPAERPRPHLLPFGCFDCEPPGTDGIVRLHFKNNDRDGTSPLGTQKVAMRTAELTDMFGEIRSRYPEARTVRGSSWLYHTEEYRRLFPPSYGDARVIVRHSRRFQGTSRWGQFLDRNGNVVAGMTARFLHNLETVDAGHLTDAFPLPTYRTEAPVRDFYEFYRIRAHLQS
jgi:hypothetical protein